MEMMDLVENTPEYIGKKNICSGDIICFLNNKLCWKLHIIHLRNKMAKIIGIWGETGTS